jgi:hypothetical protein
MKVIGRVLLSVVLSSPFLFPSWAGLQEEKTEPSEKEKKVRKMMDLTGAGKLGKQVMDAMVSHLLQCSNRRG